MVQTLKQLAEQVWELLAEVYFLRLAIL
jgi:hypothetical protein